MKKASAEFYQNRECKYFPCHKGVPEEDFNCLFCYCPLYLLGRECGGNFVYLPSGIKSCEGCTKPHGDGGYEHVMEKYKLIAQKIKEIK